MPRRPRTHLDGQPLHIVQRGHNRDACFLSEADYLAYLGWLDEALKKTGCRLHACMRYIELNPVRADMVDDPAHYRWSSYRANGLGQTDLKLTAHPVYLEIARDDSERQATYRQYFRPQLEDDAIADIRLALNQSQPLGNSRFYEQIAQTTGGCREARPRKPPANSESVAHEQLNLLTD